MLDLESLADELKEKQEIIEKWIKESDSATKGLLDKIDLLENIDASALETVDHPGARPLEEGALFRKYNRTWEDRQGALEWIDSVLSDVKVAAVDGSQIYPQKEMFLPVAVVQSALVINRHRDSDFDKLHDVKLLSPEDLGEENILPKHRDEMVDAIRFKSECKLLQRSLEEKGVFTFLDGSLVLSHIQSIKYTSKQVYLKGIIDLLNSSKESKDVLASYIDLSKSTDLCSLLSHLANIPGRPNVWDVVLLKDRMEWGDRTKAFICDRDDSWGPGKNTALEMYGDYELSIGFFYIQLSKGLPARVEFPVWIAQRGQLDKLADVIRAEVLIKGDYPDILYRAHEYAVIRAKESEIFKRMAQELLKDRLGASSKELYKARGGL